MRTCAIVSFRLGGTDGVSIIAETWRTVLCDLGWEVYTVAGPAKTSRSAATNQTADRIVDGLEIGAKKAPNRHELEAALADADLVICENILSLPMNLAASEVLAAVLTGRPALLHHHDLAWQPRRFGDHENNTANGSFGLPADDPCWRHIVINQLTKQQFAERGLQAELVYNSFDTTVPYPRPEERTAAREKYGFRPDERVFLHPVRAIARKNIPAAIALTEELGATYWLTGPVEEDYAATFQNIVSATNAPVKHRRAETLAEAYAACDLVLFPSLWEGFGNPPIEAAIFRRLVAVGHYPVSAELRNLGFDWLEFDNTDRIATALASDQTSRLNHNQQLAERHFSLLQLEETIRELFLRWGWT